jgi:hypothetical protein
MRRRWTVAVLVAVLVVGPVAATLPADALSAPNSTSADIDAVFADSSETVKIVDANGNVQSLSVTIGSAAQAHSLGGVGDYDSDGSEEVAYTSGGTFRYAGLTGIETDTGEPADHIGAGADVDGDGFTEIAYANGGFLILWNGSGTTSNLGPTDADNGVGAIVDADGDGDSDVFYIDTSANLKYSDLNGNVGTTSASARHVGGAANVDGDAEPEVAYISTGSDPDLMLTDASGNTVDTGVDASDVGGIADVDFDGGFEVVYSPSGSAGVSYVDAAASSSGSATAMDSSQGQRVGATVDLDGDGFFSIAPTIDNSSAAPDGTTVSADPVTLSMPVSDPELDDGDSVTVNVTLNGQQVGSKTITSNQTVSVSATAQDGSNTWSVTATDKNGNSVTSQTLTFTGDYAAPQGSSAPSGKITTYSGDIELQVSDSDFAAGAAESVTVEASNASGGRIGQSTVSSNQTVSFQYSALAGSNTVTWTLTDSHGLTTSVSQTFSTPGTLTVRDEQNQTVINTSGDVSVTFFGENTVEQRAITNGRADLSGLPAGDQLVAVVEADGYRTRRVILPSLFEQATVYLLNQSAPAATVTFTLDDPTGEFPPEETSLVIEKPITTNGTTEYRVVSADNFGATARYIVDLAPGARYRLRVTSGDRERLLGPYTVAGDTVQPLQIKRIEPAANERQAGDVYGGVTSDGDLAVRFRGGDDDTTVEYNVTNSSGATVVPSTTRDAAQFADIHAVNATGETFTVTYEVRDGGQVVSSGSFTAGEVAGIATRFDMDAQVLSLLSWASILMTMGLVVIVNHQLAPAAGTGVAAGLVILGTVAIPAPILGVAGAVSALALFGGRD